MQWTHRNIQRGIGALLCRRRHWTTRLERGVRRWQRQAPPAHHTGRRRPPGGRRHLPRFPPVWRRVLIARRHVDLVVDASRGANASSSASGAFAIDKPWQARDRRSHHRRGHRAGGDGSDGSEPRVGTDSSDAAADAAATAVTDAAASGGHFGVVVGMGLSVRSAGWPVRRQLLLWHRLQVSGTRPAETLLVVLATGGVALQPALLFACRPVRRSEESRRTGQRRRLVLHCHR